MGWFRSMFNHEDIVKKTIEEHEERRKAKRAKQKALQDAILRQRIVELSSEMNFWNDFDQEQTRKCQYGNKHRSA